MPIERAVRFCYVHTTHEWKEDIIQVRLQSKPFANGAMRMAYRMKIVENGNETDWVAKG